MRTLYVFLGLGLITLTFSCKTPELLLPAITVNNLHQLDSIHTNGILYTLPKTMVLVETDIKRTIRIPGPFYKFAESQLGVNEWISDNSEQYEITGFRMASTPIPDSEQIFLVQTFGVNNLNLSLSAEGLLTGVNTPYSDFRLPELFDETEPLYTETPILDYSDVMAKRMAFEATDTLFRQVIRDSTFFRIPLLETSIREKNDKDQAKDAAHFIVRLRKRRFKLVAGVYEKFYEGEALETALVEMQRLENEFLSLFVGKTFTETQTYRFSYVPKSVQQQDTTVLFRFNKFAGVIPAESQSGDPVIITADAPKINHLVQKHMTDTVSDPYAPSGIYYRMPASSTIKILFDDELLAHHRTTVAQKGTLLQIPHKLLENGDHRIWFDPTFGSLRKIEAIPQPVSEKK